MARPRAAASTEGVKCRKPAVKGSRSERSGDEIEVDLLAEFELAHRHPLRPQTHRVYLFLGQASCWLNQVFD